MEPSASRGDLTRALSAGKAGAEGAGLLVQRGSDPGLHPHARGNRSWAASILN